MTHSRSLPPKRRLIHRLTLQVATHQEPAISLARVRHRTQLQKLVEAAPLESVERRETLTEQPCEIGSTENGGDGVEIDNGHDATGSGKSSSTERSSTMARARRSCFCGRT